MIDAHVHIGQFNETWYEPALVIRTILQAGVEKVVFSSTTTCGENITYADVEKEIDGLLSIYGYGTQTIKPLLWYRPDYHKQGLGVEKAMRTLPYGGIKIHPRAQNWDPSDKNTISILHELFGYANQNELPILIHTGYDEIDKADKFSRFFPEYPHAKIVLAHCPTIEWAHPLVSSNSNVFVDTAFADPLVIGALVAFGFPSRIVTGSDFPITHHYYRERNEIDEEKDFSTQLNIQYLSDLKNFKNHEDTAELFFKPKEGKFTDDILSHNTNIVYFNGAE
jgi:hypothetical protein